MVFVPFLFMNLPEPGPIGNAYTLLVVFVFGGIWVISVVISPLAIHFDKKRIKGMSEWTPSRWYYLTYLGAIGVVLTMVYMWRRHKYIGIP